MGYNPQQPDGKGAASNWAKETHNKAQYERRFCFSSGVRGVQTSKGFVPRPSTVDDGFEFPEGIELREYDVCVQMDDGTTRGGYVRMYGTQIYFKDSQGNPVDEDGTAITDLPETTGDA